MRTAWVSLALAVPLAALPLLPCPAAGQSRGQLDSLLREAQGALQAGDYRAAVQYFERAVATEPRAPEATCGLGQAHMALKQYPDAVTALESCRRLVLDQLRRSSAEQAASYAQADLEIRELYETIGAIRSGRALQSDPGLLNRIENRIRELQELKTRERIRVEVPAPVSLALGVAYLRTGVLERAEGELLSALRVDPDAGEAHRALAEVYLGQGRWDECAEQIALAEEAGTPVAPRVAIDLKARRAAAPATASAVSPRPRTPPKESLTLDHDGRTCAANGLFVHLEATVTPSWGIHDPVVRFRSEEGSGWYSMTMLPSGGDSFATRLPRPRGAESFEYFIEVSSYDETETRTDDFQVQVVKAREDCPEAADDSNEAGATLIIDPPRDVADAPPVPPGFSIRGTTADIGVLEIGANKALIAGGIALAGAAAAGIAVASQPPEAYSGPEPFQDAPGIAFVSSNPPPGSTLSLRGGSLAIELRVYSLETMMGARITVDLTHAGWTYSSCIALTTTRDLVAGRTESVVVSGPIQARESCNPAAPIETMTVRVTRSDGLGGFRTGTPVLKHLSVLYYLDE